MDVRDRAARLHRAGDLPAAEDAYRTALERYPEDSRLRHYHASVLMRMGRLEEAVRQFEEVLSRTPAAAESACALALCLRALGRSVHALEAVEKALAVSPADPLALMVLGSLRAGFGEWHEAEKVLRRCLALAPGLTEAYHHLGVALQGQLRYQEASEAYLEVARSRPGAYFNVGVCAERMDDLLAARDHFRRACDAHPGRVDLKVRLAQVQARLCDFQGESRSVASIESRMADPVPLAADDRPEPFALAFLPLSPAVRQDLLVRYAPSVSAGVGDAAPRSHARARGSGPLRLGYISPDFGQHAVGALMRDVFAAHDRRHVSVYGYSLRRRTGEVAETIRAGCDVFRECEDSASTAIAGRIADDGIDVLIDLGGFTSGARPEVLALRPAPVQWGYLGFIHPHAAPWLDAIVLDEWVLPAGAEAGFPDPVLRLPTLLLPGGSTVPAGPVDPRRFGLPSDRVLLAAFNSSYKIDTALLEAWVEITRRAPEAMLVLSVPVQAEPFIAAAWRGRGGVPGQLALVPPLAPAEHAARLACCDLFMDAFRYQAGATAIDATAAGLPILSRGGGRPLERLGAGVSLFLGLDSLVCADAAGYVERAVALIGDPAARAHLAARVRERTAATRLLDPRRTAAAIEQVLAARA